MDPRDSDPPTIPGTSAGLTPEWFRSALAARFPGANPTAVSIEPVGVGFGLASDLSRCALEGAVCPRSVIVRL